MTWRVGAVQEVHDDQKNFAGAGFVLHDDEGRPCATFGFAKREDADACLQKMADILAAATQIVRAS